MFIKPASWLFISLSTANYSFGNNFINASSLFLLLFNINFQIDIKMILVKFCSSDFSPFLNIK